MTLRRTFLALALLSAPSLIPGHASADLPTPAQLAAILAARGRPELSIAEAGATSASKPADNRRAIQNALDAVADPASPPGRLLVTVPPGNYRIDRPLYLDGDNLTIRGEGDPRVYRSSSRIVAGDFPAFLAGMRRRPPIFSGGRLDHIDTHGTDRYADLFGVLDATAAPAPGRRFGYVPGKGWLATWANALSSGPAPGGWPGAPALCLDWALDARTAPVGRWAFGCSKGPAAAPYAVVFTPGGFNLLLSFADGSTYQGRIPFAESASVRRFSVQVNFDTGSVVAFVDGVRVPVTSAAPFRPGARLADNLFVPFKLAACGAAAFVAGDYFQSNASNDQTIAGFSLGVAPRYAEGAIGGAQARIDGKPITDALRFLSADPGTIAFLPGSTDPATDAPLRWHSITEPDPRGLALGYSPALAGLFAVAPGQTEYSGVGGLAIDRIAADGGAVVTIGSAMDMSITDSVLSGRAALFNPAWMVNYTNRVRGNTLAGTLATLVAQAGWYVLDDNTFSMCGRFGYVALNQGRMLARDNFGTGAYAAGELPRAFLSFVGGQSLIERFSVDNEEKVSPGVAFAEATPVRLDSSLRPMALVLDGCGSETHPGNVHALLHAGPPGTPTATLRVRDPGYRSADAVARTEGGWSVAVDRVGTDTVPAVLDRSGPAPVGPPAP